MASPDPLVSDLPPTADAVSPHPPSPPSPPADEAALEAEPAAETAADMELKEEEETEAEVTPSVSRKKKRGRKRKERGEVKEEGIEKKPPKPRTPRVVSTEKSVERPSRERKTVVRLIQMSPPKVPVSKVLTIAQGKGTKLKDIPNVAFKLSKRKIDENLQLLHSVMFGKKTNAYYLKRNISQFSGFVWAENEEKHRAKAKEKLDKCTKDRLLDFSELLDIQSFRNTSKKEEITEKLFEFLDSPHATRDIVLGKSEQKGKRKRRPKGVDQPANTVASSDGETKIHKSGTEIEGNKKRKQSAKIKKEDENQDAHDEREDDSDGSSDEEEDLDGGSLNKDDIISDEKADGDTDEHSDRVESEGEDDEDGQEDSIIGTNGSEERQKTREQKTKEKGSSIKKTPPAKSDKGPIKPALEDASSDDEDVPTVPARSKRGSSKGQASTTSKANKKEKSTTVNKGSSKGNKSTPKSPRKNPVNNSESVPSSSSKSKRESKKKDQSNDTSVPEDTKAVKKLVGKSESKVSTKEQEKGKASRKPKVKPPTREELYAVISKILKKVDFNTATLADILKQLGKLFKTNLMDRKAEVKEIIQEVINEMPDEEDGEEDGEEDEEDARSAEAEDDVKQESDEDDE